MDLGVCGEFDADYKMCKLGKFSSGRRPSKLSSPGQVNAIGASVDVALGQLFVVQPGLQSPRTKQFLRVGGRLFS